MKKKQRILLAVMLLTAVLWLITSVVRLIHFKLNPEYYLALSAPWNTFILLNALVGGLIILICTILWMILRAKQRRTERETAKALAKKQKRTGSHRAAGRRKKGKKRK